MKRYIMLVLFAGLLIQVSAQQLQTSSMYEMQGVLHDPSMAGVLPNNVVGASYRAQWNGFNGGPKTGTVFANFNLPKQEIGIAGNLYNDKTGPTTRTGVALSVAKHILLQKGAKLSFGIETRFQQFAINTAKLTESLGSDPVLAGAGNKFKFDAGFGASYTDAKFQIGAAVSQLIQSKLDIYSGNLNRSQEGRLYRHYYLHSHYNWDVDASARIIPNFLMIYMPNAPTEVTIGARVEHNQLFWWGLAYRVKQSYMLSAGVNINKKITIGYSFDNYVSPINTFDKGTNGHEVLLRYNIIK
jgi:type IX secretion system PorP/SprF family membrane protein